MVSKFHRLLEPHTTGKLDELEPLLLAPGSTSVRDLLSHLHRSLL